MSSRHAYSRRCGRRPGAVGLLLIVGASGQSVSPEGTAVTDAPRPAILITQVPAEGSAAWRVEAGSAIRPMPTGGRIVICRFEAPGPRVSVLTRGFAAAGRPSLSYDATKVLFVGRRDAGAEDSVWEVGVDGTGLRDVVAPAGGTDRAIYLSTLYTIQSERPMPRIAYRAVGYGGEPQLFSCGIDGEDVRPITFAPGGVFDPVLLSDGRLLFGMDGPGEPTSSGVPPRGGTWFTSNIDGTDLFPFAAAHEPVRSRGAAFESFDDEVLYLERRSGTDPGFDTIVAVARTDSLISRRVVARIQGGGLFDAAALPGGGLLATHKASSAATIGVFAVRGSRVVSRPVMDDNKWHEVDAEAVVARARPPGRSSVVAPSRGSGRLYCLDAYLSVTEAGRRIERGQLRQVRFLTPHRAPSGRADDRAATRSETHAGDAVLGHVPVEADGSFSVELPARTPFRMESLDDAGTVVQSMRTWMWVMPGERRGCIGCHEDRAMTPPNRHVTALRRRPWRIGIDDTEDAEESPE